jgi:hypothetical protein
MTTQSGTTIDLALESSVDDEVRAAFTERVRADVARLLADSLAARATAFGAGAGAGGASRRLLREAADHDREAQRHEARAVVLRQLEHDGRL